MCAERASAVRTWRRPEAPSRRSCPERCSRCAPGWNSAFDLEADPGFLAARVLDVVRADFAAAGDFCVAERRLDRPPDPPRRHRRPALDRPPARAPRDLPAPD